MATVAALPALNSARDSISTWIRNRVRSRRGPMTPPFELEYRHIFVLPTKFGWGFGVMLVFMALGGLGAGIALGVSEVFSGVGFGLLYVILGVVTVSSCYQP